MIYSSIITVTMILMTTLNRRFKVVTLHHFTGIALLTTILIILGTLNHLLEHLIRRCLTTNFNHLPHIIILSYLILILALLTNIPHRLLLIIIGNLHQSILLLLRRSFHNPHIDQNQTSRLPRTNLPPVPHNSLVQNLLRLYQKDKVRLNYFQLSSQ
jgi:hypothetical protein